MPDDLGIPDLVAAELRAWLRSAAPALLDGRLRGKVDPSDVAQDAMLRALADTAPFRGQTEAELRAWVRRILVTTLADAVRRFLTGQKRGVGRERSLDEAVQHSSDHLARCLADGRTPPDEAAARAERLVWLAEGLADLPDDQREAVRLRHLERLPVGEVARRMSRTTAAVAGLLRRGLETLRARPGADGGA